MTDQVTQLVAWKIEQDKRNQERNETDRQINLRLLTLEKETLALQQRMTETLDYCKILAETQQKHGDHLEKRHDIFVANQIKANDRIEQAFNTLSQNVDENTKSNVQIHATVKAVGWILGFLGTLTAIVGCIIAVMTYVK